MHNGISPQVDDNGAYFQVWAPKPDSVELFLPDFLDQGDLVVPMDRKDDFWQVYVSGAGAGTRYFYRLNGEIDRPDPASRFQPDGVHGASSIAPLEFEWREKNWRGLLLEDYVLYELHVGTFTKQGTFEGIIPHLSTLKDLGVTAIELMPISQFPGTRNWGYDGVYPYAVQNSYGGSQGLARLVSAAHKAGLAVVLDVVYNHLGPEGNYLDDFGYYFTDCFKTPWGRAINYCEAYSDPVREYFLNNAIYWLDEFRIDGLRLDACHFILDNSAFHILEELQDRVAHLAEKSNRRINLFIESDSNDTRYINPRSEGGWGYDALWLDDFHHSLYTMLHGIQNETYDEDYGKMEQFAKAWKEGFVYAGDYCPRRKHRHGRSSRGISGKRFVTFIQNHDQIGNSPGGTRLAQEVSWEALKLAAAAYILSPYIPMIFMGEEYGETRPFLYFTDHSDPELIRSVDEGRRREFASSYAGVEWSDCHALETFEQSIINSDGPPNEKGQTLYRYYQTLLKLRRDYDALRNFKKDDIEVFTGSDTMSIMRKSSLIDCLICLNFSVLPKSVSLPDKGPWVSVLDSAHPEWLGPGVAKVMADSVAMPPESALILAWKE